MSDSICDPIYDPLAMPNPADDDDPQPIPPTSDPRSSWSRRGIAQILLTRARERQEAIADAFVDALLKGNISLFRLLIALEQQAAAAEAEAAETAAPSLAQVLLPMLERERKEATATPQAAHQSPEPAPAQPTLPAPASEKAQSTGTIQPGITDLQAARTTARICRGRAPKRHPGKQFRPQPRSGQNPAPAAQSHTPGPPRRPSRQPKIQPQSQFQPLRKKSPNHTIQIVSPAPPNPPKKSQLSPVNRCKKTTSTPNGE